MRNLSSSPTWDDAPQTKALLHELQSTPVPFEFGFWQLLELTRTLEVENTKFKKSRQKKARGVVKSRRGKSGVKSMPKR